MTVLTRPPESVSAPPVPEGVVLTTQFLLEARELGDPDIMQDAYQDLVQNAGRDSGVPRAATLPYIRGHLVSAENPLNRSDTTMSVREALGESLSAEADAANNPQSTIEVEARVLAEMWVKDPHNQAFIGAVATEAANSYGDWGGAIFARTFRDTAQEALLLSGETDKTTRLRLRLLGGLAFVHAEDQRSADGGSVAERMLSGRSAKIIPSFDEAVDDPTRQSTFTSKVDGLPSRTLTESEGIKELDNFFAHVLSTIDSSGLSAVEKAELTRLTTSLRLNLSFVGERALNEAAGGIANMWMTYLDADPKNKICVLTDIGSLDRYDVPAKSDAYVLDKVLANIPESVRSRYGERLVFNAGILPEDEATDAKHMKVILLDDWTLSGRQLRDVHEKRLMSDTRYRELFTAGAVEVNTLIATSEQLRDGLATGVGGKGVALPVRAYYRARSIPAAADTRGIHAHITGLHSTANRGFQDEIELLRRRLGLQDIPLPALAQITAPYKHSVRRRDR